MYTSELANGTLVLSDEVRIYLAGRRPLYGSFMQPTVTPEQHVVLTVGRSAEIRIGFVQPNAKLWVRRYPTWVSTVTTEICRIKYLHVKNLSNKVVTLY